MGCGLGRGCALPSCGSGDLPQTKKINFALKKYAILSKFWYFFPVLQQKVGGLSPSPESGGPILLSPCSDAYGSECSLMWNVNVVNRTSCFCIMFFLDGIGGGFGHPSHPMATPLHPYCCKLVD